MRQTHHVIARLEPRYAAASRFKLKVSGILGPRLRGDDEWWVGISKTARGSTPLPDPPPQAGMLTRPC